MRRKAIFMALLVLAFGAQAVPVSVEQVRQAARAWVNRGGTLGARLGSAVDGIATQATSQGVKIHAVTFKGGGTVFMSSDTAIEPVVLFTSEAVDFEQIDKAGPLWALLQRDADVRASVRKSAAGANGAAAAEPDLWAELVSEGAALESGVRQLARGGVPSVGDLRVSALVKSRWSQDKVGATDCYNRYTPMLTTGSRAVCGCVATAMSQVMRYHEFPKASVASVTRECTVEATDRGKAANTNLTMQAGIYDWDLMELDPKKNDVSDEQCKAIGKLTSDAGISVYMNYDKSSPGYGGSGAFMFNVSRALTEVFGYANADFYTASEISDNPGIMQKAMFSNFDAGYPVLMGISGNGGHAIIGDGYGYNAGKPYVHLNMGWSGTDDAWYNLPNIGTSYAFDVFDDLVFNIFPAVSGSGKMATLSGRVTDDDGVALATVPVRVYAAGTATLVTNGLTSPAGVYGFLLPAGTYDVQVEKSGCPVEELLSVGALQTTTAKKTFSGWINQSIGWSKSYADIPYVTGVGNVWGKDVELTQPLARIVTNGIATVYSSLDKAIVGARSAAAVVSPEPVTIEVLGELRLEKAATVDFDCVLTATNADPSVSQILRGESAALTVAAGGSLVLSNVVFSSGATTVVDVQAGGCVAVGEGVFFGVPASVAAVRTADGVGFVLAGALSSGFSLDCSGAFLADDVFGRATCDYLTASNSAALVANFRDAHSEIRGIAVEDLGDVLLKWQEQPVPLADSAGYFVDADGNTNTAARLDRLLEKYELAVEAGAAVVPEIVLRNRTDLELTRLTTVTNSLTIRGENAGVAVKSFGAAAGFVVGTNGTLTVRDLSFANYAGDALFLVKDGGELKVAGRTTFSDIEGKNQSYSGALTVLSGKATVGSYEGVEFVRCRNEFQESCGGAIYLNGAGCELVLTNYVSVTNCSARRAGGGVYIGKDAVVSLAGTLKIRDNVSAYSGEKTPDDVYYTMPTAAHTLRLDGRLGAGSAVGIRSNKSALTKVGGEFIGVGEGLTDHDAIRSSAKAFFNDVSAARLAEPNGTYSALRWYADDGSIHPVDPAAAVASVNGEFYGSIEDAFGVLTAAESTVEILRDTTMSGVLSVTGRVTLTSGAGGPFTVTRALPCRFDVGGSLVVEGLTVAGDPSDARHGTGPLFAVREGGSLTLGDGAVVQGAVADAEHPGGAVYVRSGAFTMLDGSLIRDCVNVGFEDSRGGAVTVDRMGMVRLLGGTVTNCVARDGGGVYIGNNSTVVFGGSFTATENRSETGVSDNLYVTFLSSLLLESPQTGRIGYVPGVKVDPCVFGRVATNYTGTSGEAADSAHRFTHDLTGDVGLAVSGTNGTLLVWSDAVDSNGVYVAEGGVTNRLVAGGEILKTTVPVMLVTNVYDGIEHQVALSGHGWYVVSGVSSAVNAGTNAVSVAPKAGFTWDDGLTDVRTVQWWIEKATYDMSGVFFRNDTVYYDGKAHSLSVTGDLPVGVTNVSYVGNEQTDIGIHTVRAKFLGDVLNYNPIPDMTATLTILAVPPPEPPDPPVVTNRPDPIAFQSIERLDENRWRLVVTNLKAKCEYSLAYTADLMSGFGTTGAWMRAVSDGPWTTNVIFSAEEAKPAFFWKALGRETYDIIDSNP